MRLPASNDTRLLVVGVAAFVALVAYLGVALRRHARHGRHREREVAPWTPYGSTLRARAAEDAGEAGRAGDRVGAGRRFDRELRRPGSDARPCEPTAGATFAVGLWLKTSPAGADRRPDPRVSARRRRATTSSTRRCRRRPRWHHFTFRGQVNGSWTGLSMYVFRPTMAAPKPSPAFVIRGLAVKLR